MVIFRRAVSALWRAQETRLECFKKVIFRKVEFSRILARNGRLEMGWRLLRLLGSVLGFFSIGMIAAVFR